MLATLSLGLAMFLLLFALGIGVARLLFPPRYEDLRRWMAPWLGIALIVVFGGTLSIGKQPMSTAYGVILATGLTLTLYSFLTDRPRQFQLKKETMILSVLVIVLSLANVYPLLTRVGYPTTLSMGNLDPVAYMNVGEYLRDHTILDGGVSNVFKPASWSVADLLHYGFRAGPSLILSFFAVTLQVKTHVIYTVLLSVAFALTFPLVYLLGKKMLGTSSIIFMWIVFLVFGLNATLLYWLTHAFLPQFLFGGFFVASGLLFLEYSEDKRRQSWITGWDLAIGICFAAILTIYPDGLLLSFTPIALAGIVGYVTGDNRSLWLKSLKILGVALVINPIAFATALRQIMRLVVTTTNTTFIGWEWIRTPSLFEMMGLHNLYYARNLPLWADILLSLPVLYCLFLAFRTLTLKLVTGSYVLVMVGFLGLYLLVIDNFFVFNRVLGYTLFMWSTLFAVGLTHLFKSINRKLFTVLGLLILTLTSLRTIQRSMQQNYYHYRVVDQALSTLELIPPVTGPFYTADIVLGEFDLWKRVWQEHFLRNQTLVDRQNYVLLAPADRTTKLVLAEKEKVRQYPELFDFTSIVWESEWYILGTPRTITVSEDLR